MGTPCSTHQWARNVHKTGRKTKKIPLVRPKGTRKDIIIVKGQVDPVLLTEHHAMKAYWGSGDTAPLIL